MTRQALGFIGVAAIGVAIYMAHGLVIAVIAGLGAACIVASRGLA